MFEAQPDPRAPEVFPAGGGCLLVWTLDGQVELWHEDGARIAWARHQGDELDDLIAKLQTIRQEQGRWQSERMEKIRFLEGS